MFFQGLPTPTISCKLPQHKEEANDFNKDFIDFASLFFCAFPTKVYQLQGTFFIPQLSLSGYRRVIKIHVC